MRCHILLILLLTVGCREGTRLQQVTKCGQPCYQLPGDAGVGQCRSGVWACEDDSEESAVCVDQIGPSRELCDGVDNDCDGEVDEYISRTCSNTCGAGLETCKEGLFEGCTAPTPKPETCNGIDDDCDGKYDEPEDLPLEFCYDGPAGSTQFGQCKPGVLRCEYGRKTCFGQQVPLPEACDGLDNDCDGQIDEGSGNNDPVDIVFVIDNSGSMGNTISAVKQAVNSFTNTYGQRADIRWGLVVAPDPDVVYDAQVRRYSDLNTAQVFAAAMQNMGSNGGGSEPTLDAITFLTSASNPLGMSWRASSRHVIVLFTDEEPQSYTTPQATVFTVFTAIQTTATRVYVFTSMPAVWSPALPTGWGQIRALTSVASTMESELNSVVEEVSCR